MRSNCWYIKYCRELAVVCASALLVLRTYAVCGRSLLMLSTGFSVVLARAALAIYADLVLTICLFVDLKPRPSLCLLQVGEHGSLFNKSILLILHRDCIF